MTRYRVMQVWRGQESDSRVQFRTHQEALDWIYFDGGEQFGIKYEIVEEIFGD